MPIYRPLDTEAEALIGKIKSYLKDSNANAPDFSSIMSKYNKLASFPIQEFTPEVWDELTDLVNNMV